jgi:hypothetical protein
MIREKSVLGNIGNLIDSINEDVVKQANAKKASELKGSDGGDPGSVKGPTASPTGKLDGNTQKPSFGARANENEKDVEGDVANSPGAVSNSLSDATNEHDSPNIGLHQSATGEDPSAENAFKGTKEDPGTSAPLDGEDMGEKYSSTKLASMSFDALYNLSIAKTEHLLARLGDGQTFTNAKAAADPAAKTTPAPTPTEAAAAGYALADLAAANSTKEAAVNDLVASIIKEACDAADLVGELLYKNAEQEQQMMPPDGQQLPPALAGGGGEMPPGGGGGMPPEMGGGGGMPPGADPMAGGGGMPPGGEGGAPGGGGADEGIQAINEMANSMIEAGIPPEKLMEALEAVAAQMGGGGEGAPPEAGGGGEGAPPAPEEKAGSAMTREEMEGLYKCAYSVAKIMENGQFRRIRPAKNSKQATDQKAQVDYLNYAREVLRMK